MRETEICNMCFLTVDSYIIHEVIVIVITSNY